MIALDSPVLMDVLTSSPHADRSEAALRLALAQGPVVICDVVAVEVCSYFNDSAELMQNVHDMGIAYATVDEKSALRASEMQRKFRARGGQRGQRTAADFLIGAHAMLQCDGLITRDDAFFRDYFKGLKLIVPKPA